MGGGGGSFCTDAVALHADRWLGGLAPACFLYPRTCAWPLHLPCALPRADVGVLQLRAQCDQASDRVREAEEVASGRARNIALLTATVEQAKKRAEEYEVRVCRGVPNGRPVRGHTTSHNKEA